MELKEIVPLSAYHDKTGMLLQGDCIEWMEKIPDCSIDMVLCDLPYGTTACKWDVIIPFEPLWEQYRRIVKNSGAIVLTANQPFTSLLVCSNLEMFRYRWIWDKRVGANFQLANLQPMNTAEDICVFSKAKTANGAKLNMEYYPQKTKRDSPIKSGGAPNSKLLHDHNMVALHRTYEDKFPISILTFDKPSGKERLHPTQKPVLLFEYLINTYTKEGMVVLDNASGSCTTAISCRNLKRKWICIEKEQKYIDISVDRIKKHLVQ